MHTDVTVESEVAALVERTVTEYERIDCAFNNAGFEEMEPLMDQTEAISDSTLDKNVEGIFFCMKYEILAIKEAGGGSIVNESSLAGIKGIPDNAPTPPANTRS